MSVSDLVSDFSDRQGVGEAELVKWYYCSVLTSDAVEMRRGGGVGKLGDRHVLVPKIRAMERRLNGGDVEGFFENKDVCAEGLSVEGFVQFVGKLDCAAREYAKREGYFGRGWRN